MLACCAFAVFLLNQLLLPFTFIRERVFGRGEARRNDAVAWTPGMAAATPDRRPGRLRPAMALIVAVEVLAIGGSVAAATLASRARTASSGQQLLDAMHLY